MYEGKFVGVVVPAYNEEDHVGDVISTIPSYIDRIYPVDDASSDKTWREIKRAANRVNENSVSENGESFDRTVVPISHNKNRGVGGAIKTGYRRALEDDIDVVAVMGGDGQMDPALLENIIDPVVKEQADYAKGNRFLLSETRCNVPLFRKFGNQILSGLTKTASGYWSIGDSQNGFSAISKEALEAINFEDMYEFYGYCNDLLVKLNVANMIVADIPVPIRYANEDSSIDYHTYIPRVSKMLLGNFLWRLKTKYLIKDFNPVVLMYVLGIIGGGLSVLRLLAKLHDNTPEKEGSGALTNFLISSLMFIHGIINDKHENEHLAKRKVRSRSGPIYQSVDTDGHSDYREHLKDYP